MLRREQAEPSGAAAARQPSEDSLSTRRRGSRGPAPRLGSAGPSTSGAGGRCWSAGLARRTRDARAARAHDAARPAPRRPRRPAPAAGRRRAPTGTASTSSTSAPGRAPSRSAARWSPGGASPPGEVLVRRAGAGGRPGILHVAGHTHGRLTGRRRPAPARRLGAADRLRHRRRARLSRRLAEDVAGSARPAAAALAGRGLLARRRSTASGGCSARSRGGRSRSLGAAVLDRAAAGRPSAAGRSRGGLPRPAAPLSVRPPGRRCCESALPPLPRSAGGCWAGAARRARRCCCSRAGWGRPGRRRRGAGDRDADGSAGPASTLPAPRAPGCTDAAPAPTSVPAPHRRAPARPDWRGVVARAEHRAGPGCWPLRTSASSAPWTRPAAAPTRPTSRSSGPCVRAGPAARRAHRPRLGRRCAPRARAGRPHRG